MNFIKTFQSLEPSKLINLLILFLCALCFWTSITSLLPTLPAYIQDIGATVKQVGYVMGCFAIGLLLSRVWLGKLADNGLSYFLRGNKSDNSFIRFCHRLARQVIGKLVDYPSRKVVIIIGAIVATLAPVGYLFLTSIPELMAIRAFHGISIAAFTTGYSALVVDLSPPKQKGELIGYMSLAIPIGMAIGPIFGGFLQEYTSYQVLFAVSALFGFSSFILATQIRELEHLIDKSSQSLEPKSLNNTDSSRTFQELLANPSFFIPAIVLLLIGCLFGALITYLPLYIRFLNLDFNVGLFYTAAAISSFAVRFFAGQASDKYGRGRFISISLLCYMTSMLLLALANSNNMILLSAAIEGAGAGMLIPITLALISDRCSIIERGKVFAVCISGFDVGVALGGPVLGSFLLDWGYRFLFAVTCGLATIALLIFVSFANKNLVNSWRFAWGKGVDLYAIKQN